MKRILLLILLTGSFGLLAQAQDAAGEKQVAKEKAATQPVATKEAKPVEEAAKKADSSSEEAAKNADVAVKEEPVDPAIEKDLEKATAKEQGEAFVAPRETVQETAPAPVKKELVVYQPKNRRDPTLSPDDFLLLQYREQQRLAAIEAERQRKLAEERRKREEEERLRQLELARIKDPTREVRNKIKIGGIVGQEVFIGDKVYTVGNKIFGARIVEITPDSVVFLYKGHKFVRKMK